MGGEHDLAADADVYYRGSSPRGRGTRVRLGQLLLILGIIPAWAGNTEETMKKLLFLMDHPRVGGEHPVLL